MPVAVCGNYTFLNFYNGWIQSNEIFIKISTAPYWKNMNEIKIKI